LARQQLNDLSEEYADDSAEAESFKADVEKIQQFLENPKLTKRQTASPFSRAAPPTDFFETAQLDVAFPNNRFSLSTARTFFRSSD
jgi:hypothetical protein